MRIDKSHISWLVFSGAVLVAASLVYFLQPRTAGGRGGGTVVGLALGATALLFILLAGALAPRKRVRAWRLGSAQLWMRAHLWLGALAVPLVWFHGGFRHGGALTTVLMWLLYAVVLSGLVGAAFQHALPRRLTAGTIGMVVHDRIDDMLHALLEEADQIIASVESETAGEVAEVAVFRGADADSARAAWRSSDTLACMQAAPQSIENTAGDADMLEAFYVARVRPILAATVDNSSTADVGDVRSLFEQQRAFLPPRSHRRLARLEQVVCQANQLRAQEGMRRWLQGWMLLHIPLSAAFVVLAVVHAVIAVRYG